MLQVKLSQSNEVKFSMISFTVTQVYKPDNN